MRSVASIKRHPGHAASVVTAHDVYRWAATASENIDQLLRAPFEAVRFSKHSLINLTNGRKLVRAAATATTEFCASPQAGCSARPWHRTCGRSALCLLSDLEGSQAGDGSLCAVAGVHQVPGHIGFGSADFADRVLLIKSAADCAVSSSSAMRSCRLTPRNTWPRVDAGNLQPLPGQQHRAAVLDPPSVSLQVAGGEGRCGSRLQMLSRNDCTTLRDGLQVRRPSPLLQSNNGSHAYAGIADSSRRIMLNSSDIRASARKSCRSAPSISKSMTSSSVSANT